MLCCFPLCYYLVSTTAWLGRAGNLRTNMARTGQQLALQGFMAETTLILALAK